MPSMRRSQRGALLRDALRLRTSPPCPPHPHASGRAAAGRALPAAHRERLGSDPGGQPHGGHRLHEPLCGAAPGLYARGDSGRLHDGVHPSRRSRPRTAGDHGAPGPPWRHAGDHVPGPPQGWSMAHPGGPRAYALALRRKRRPRRQCPRRDRARRGRGCSPRQRGALPAAHRERLGHDPDRRRRRSDRLHGTVCGSSPRLHAGRDRWGVGPVVPPPGRHGHGHGVARRARFRAGHVAQHLLPGPPQGRPMAPLRGQLPNALAGQP